MNILLYFYLSVMTATTPLPPVFDTDEHASWWAYYEAVDPTLTYGEQADRFYALAVFLMNQNPAVLDRNHIWQKTVDHWMHDFPGLNIDEE